MSLEEIRSSQQHLGTESRWNPPDSRETLLTMVSDVGRLAHRIQANGEEVCIFI